MPVVIWQLAMSLEYCPNVWMYLSFLCEGNGGDIQWSFSQVKGTIEEDVTEGKKLESLMRCLDFVCQTVKISKQIIKEVDNITW